MPSMFGSIGKALTGQGGKPAAPKMPMGQPGAPQNNRMGNMNPPVGVGPSAPPMRNIGFNEGVQRPPMGVPQMMRPQLGGMMGRLGGMTPPPQASLPQGQIPPQSPINAGFPQRPQMNGGYEQIMGQLGGNGGQNIPYGPQGGGMMSPFMQQMQQQPQMRPMPFMGGQQFGRAIG